MSHQKDTLSLAVDPHPYHRILLREGPVQRRPLAWKLLNWLDTLNGPDKLAVGLQGFVKQVLGEYVRKVAFWHLTVFVFPFLFLLAIFGIQRATLEGDFSPLHRFLIVEDGPLEWFQFVTLMFAGSLAVSAALFFRGGRQRRNAVMLFGLGASLLFVAGEEVSWFQRQLLIETPSVWGSLNRQGELNVHNLDAVMDIFSLGYVVLGFGLGLAWLFRVALQTWLLDRGLTPSLVPSWWLSPYFVLIAGMLTITVLWPDFPIPYDGESWETLFYLGFLGIVMQVHGSIVVVLSTPTENGPPEPTLQ